MKGLGGLSAQDISTIAATGVMGLSIVFLITVFWRGKTPPTSAIWAAVFVIALAAIVQVVTKAMDMRLNQRSRLSMTLSPEPTIFAQLLPAAAGVPLTARPHLWLDGGAPKCDADRKRAP